MTKKTNADLKEAYNQAHSDPSFWTLPTADITEAVVDLMDWSGKTVLEIGCGDGLTSRELAKVKVGAFPVIGYDYSEEAIRRARESMTAELREKGGLQRCTYVVGSVPEVAEGCEPPTYDVVLAQEVLEHMDDPGQSLKDWAQYVKPGGHLIITCPSFLNPRGIVWMTLQVLLDVPMSLTDLHFINVWDMAKWSKDAGLVLKNMKSIRHDVGWGDLMVDDLRKRLNNALADRGIAFVSDGEGERPYIRDEFHPAVDRFLIWLRQASGFMDPRAKVMTGACSLYVMQKPEEA